MRAPSSGQFAAASRYRSRAARAPSSRTCRRPSRYRGDRRRSCRYRRQEAHGTRPQPVRSHRARGLCRRRGWPRSDPADPNLGGIDLPSSPDFTIDHRLVAPPIGGRLGDCDEPPGLDGLDGKGDPAHAIDIDRWHEYIPNSADAKVARTLDGTKALEQLGTNRRHGNSRQAGQRFVNDRRVDVLGLQEMISSSDSRKSSGHFTPTKASPR